MTKNKRAGEIHASRETGRTRGEHRNSNLEAVVSNFRCFPRIACPPMSRGISASLAFLFVAEIRDNLIAVYTKVCFELTSFAKIFETQLVQHLSELKEFYVCFYNKNVKLRICKS